MAAGRNREQGNESRRGDRGDPQARRRRDHLRLSGQPHPGIRGARRHTADHRAPGADRPAHGRRALAPDQRAEARRVRDAARPRRRERVRRRRAGLRRGGADPGAASGLSPPDRLRGAELQFRPQHARRHQIRRADPFRRRDPEHLPARVHPPEERARRPGADRGAGRHLRRGGERAARLHAGHHAPGRARSRGGAHGRKAPRCSQAPGDQARRSRRS